MNLKTYIYREEEKHYGIQTLQRYSDADLKGPLVIVMGAEGKGVSPLTRKLCDFCVRIPMKGKVSSLNVSVAAALLIYEAAKQRGE